MNIDKLERANILAKSLIPKVDELLAMSSNSYNGKLADAPFGGYHSVIRNLRLNSISF